MPFSFEVLQPEHRFGSLSEVPELVVTVVPAGAGVSEGRRAGPQGRPGEARDREGRQLPSFTWRGLRCQTAQPEDLDAGFDEIAHRTGVAFPRICAQQTRRSVVNRANLSLTTRANGRTSSACARSSRSLIQPR